MYPTANIPINNFIITNKRNMSFDANMLATCVKLFMYYIPNVRYKNVPKQFHIMAKSKKQLIMESIKKAKIKTKQELMLPDYSIIQAVSMLEEYNDMINRLYERIFAWYDYYFPELKDILSISEYAQFIVEYDFKHEYNGQLSEKKTEIVQKALKNRIGAEPDRDSLKMIKRIAENLVSLINVKNELEKFIESNTKKIAPNMCSIAPPIVVAQLLRHAGGMEKLAMLPSSTIQVFGAEKALFKHLRTGSNPPKHGVIFQIPEIAKAPKNISGRVSRLYANQLSIAARADWFTHKDLSSFLKKDIKERLDEISHLPVKHKKKQNFRKSKRNNHGKKSLGVKRSSHKRKR